MRYFVVGDDGNKYGPGDVATLNSWIAEGRLISSTLLEEEGSGARIAASAVPGLSFPTVPPPVEISQPGGAYSQPPGAPTATAFTSGPQVPYSEAGKGEVIASWILGVLGLLCGVCGVLFSIIGIVLGVVAKNKGNRNGQAAMIFNIVTLVIALLITLLVIPAMTDSLKNMTDNPLPRSMPIPR